MRSLFRTFIGLVGVLSQLGLLLVVVVDVLPFGPRGVAALVLMGNVWLALRS